MKLKNRVKIIISLSILLVSCYVIFYNYLPPYTPLKSTKLYSGLEINKDVLFEKDTSLYNFRGEGYTEFVLKFSEEQYEGLLLKNDFKTFKKLPIAEKLPSDIPLYYFNYLEKKVIEKYHFFNDTIPDLKDHLGFYKIKTKENNDFVLIILDNFEKRLYIYSKQ